MWMVRDGHVKQTEHAPAGHEYGSQLYTALGRALLPHGDFSSEFGILSALFVCSITVALWIGVIERRALRDEWELKQAKKKNEDRRQKRGVFSYPDGGNDAVRKERRGGGQR
jgi:hypothetical protein